MARFRGNYDVVNFKSLDKYISELDLQQIAFFELLVLQTSRQGQYVKLSKNSLTKQLRTGRRKVESLFNWLSGLGFIEAQDNGRGNDTVVRVLREDILANLGKIFNLDRYSNQKDNELFFSQQYDYLKKQLFLRPEISLEDLPDEKSEGYVQMYYH